MSIRTRSAVTLVARLQELRQEEEEILAELRQRAAENEPENGAGDEETTEAHEPMQLEEKPNFDRFRVAEGGNQHTMSGHARQAELCGLTFVDNQEEPHWQVTDWPPLPFESRAIHASVVVNDPGGHNSKTGRTTVVVLSSTHESNMVHVLHVDDMTQNLCWRVGPSMNQTRLFLAAVICRGYVYAVGGKFDTIERIGIQDLLGNSSKSSSPTNNKRRGWMTLECRLSEKRLGCSATVVKERFIVVAGGCFEMSTLASIDILDTAASTNSGSGVVVRAGPPMNVGRSHFGMEVIGSRLFAVSGIGDDEMELSSVEYLELDDWVLEGPGGGPQHSIVISPSNKVSSCWTNTWKIHPQLALDTPRGYFGMVRVGSCLVVVGGDSGTLDGLRSVLVLDTHDNVVCRLPEMIEERDGCTLVALSTTGIVAIGGSDDGTCERLPLVDQKSVCFARCLALGMPPPVLKKPHLFVRVSVCASCDSTRTYFGSVVVESIP